MGQNILGGRRLRKLGFGIMRLPTLPTGTIDTPLAREMIDSYLKAGFSYFDTAYKYHNGEAEIFLRENLVERYPRDRFILADKLPTWLIDSKEKMRFLLSEQLEKCGVDCFDMLLFHNLGESRYQRIMRLGAFDLLRRFKEEGLAKHIGFSYHDAPEILDRILTEHPEIDFVQLQINYLDWDNPGIRSRGCYEVAVKHDKPVIVMEPVKGGTLANLSPEVGRHLAELNGGSQASYAIRYAASLDHVAIVLSGMSTMEQLMDNIRSMSDFQPLSEEEYAAIEKTVSGMKDQRRIPCTGCRYCVEESKCPVGIPIPDILGVYNSYTQALQEDALRTSTVLYHRVTQGRGKPEKCIDCGQCERHCPQHLNIREHLQLIRDTLVYPLANE